MMSAHIIEELCFDVDFGSEDEAFDAQERLMRFAQGRAQQVIAEVFDEAIEPDAILRLEKLQVDIGTLNAVDFEDRFAERLRDELRTLLRDRRAEVGQSAGDHSAESASPSVGHLTTGARAEIDWLLHFIEYGYLPWHAPAHIGRDMHALAARVLERNGTQLARALRAAPVSHRRAIFRRLVAQFPAEWLAGLGRQIGLAKRQSLVAPAGEAIAPAITPGGIGIDVAQDHAAYTATHAAYSRANSEPAEVVAVSHRASAESEIPRATRTVVPGDLHEVLARSRFRAQIEALLSESPESDFALVTSMPVSPDTWRSVLRDDAPWLKSTLLHLGRGIRVRRRLAAVLPKEVVPGLIALWFSPTQVDRVLAAIGATAPFTRELPNTDVSRDAISATGLLDTLTYILVDGGATEFSESGYRRSLANQTARHADEAVDRGGISASPTLGLQASADLHLQNDRHDDRERLADTLPEDRATPLSSTRRSPAEQKQPEVTEVRGADAVNVTDTVNAPAIVNSVNAGNSADSEIRRATHAVVPDDLHEVLAPSRFRSRAQIEAVLGETPESDFALVASMPVSPDTWRSVLRDDAHWLKTTLPHLGRGIRARRRLAAVLPEEVVPELLALWLSPTQVDRVLAAIGATAPFTRELANADVSRGAISATVLLDTLTYILVDGGATEFSESDYRRSLANQTARHADEAVDRGGISSGSIPALQSNAEPGDKTRDLPPSPAAARVLVGTARVGSLESRTTVGKNPAAHPATDATAQSLALSDSPAAADQDARPDVQRLPDAGTTSDARPSTAARSDADLTAPATPAFAARAAVHSKTLLQVNPVVPAAAHFQAHSEPAEVAAVSLRASADSEIRRATHTVVPDDLHEALARSRFRSRAQIEAALSESPESDFAPVTSIAVSPDTWRSVLRDDAPWLKTTLLHLGRGIRVRRRLAAVLPEEIVPDLLALWFSPTQVDAVLATIGASAALFTGEPSNPDIPRDALSPAGLLATLTYILVEGGAWEFSESGYWRSLANQTARVGDEALDRDRTAAGPIPGPRSSADPSPQNDRHDDLEHLAHPLSEGRATPLTPTRRSPAEKKQPTVAEVRGAEPPPPSPRTRRDTTYASSVENRTIAAANLADPPATDAAARAFGLSNSSAAADQGARPDIPLLPEAAAISDARPETSTAALFDTNPTAPVTTRDPAVRPAAHFETPTEVNLALPAAMHFQADSEPAEVIGVGPRTPTGPERLRATNTLGPGEPREALANLRAHAQSLDGRATQLTESSGSPVAKQSATADHLTKGSGSSVAKQSATADHLTKDSGSPVARESATAEHLTKGSGSPVATESATAEHPTRGSGSPVATESATAELSHQPLDIAVAQNGHYVPSPPMVKSRDDTERDIPSLRDTHTDTDTGAKQPAQTTLGAHSPGAPSPTAANSRAVTSNEACQATFTTALPKPPPATHETPPLTELPDSTPGVTLAASGTSPAPYDADLLRHLRGALTANSPTNVLRRALRTVLDQRSAAARRALLSALEYPGAAHRLAALLTVDDLPDVLQWLRPTDGAMALAIAARVIRLGQSAGDHITPRQDEARGSSSPASDGADREKNNDTGTDVVTRVASEFLLTELFEEGRTLDPEPFAQRLTAALGAALAPQAQSESTIAERTHSSYIARSSTRPAADLPPKNAVTMAEDDAITQRIYIANAGIVIVGPYLPRLFSMLELTNKGSFTTLSSAYRAVHLIQYIVTQSTVTPEPMLVLNKILCGLPVSAPIPLEIDLRAQEQAAIEDMLTAIIAHWKAIGRTSIAGLRESFLQREGRLVFTDDAWRLRVESKSFDMLIDRLPWGYTMVKYPWMKRVLHVDWR